MDKKLRTGSAVEMGGRRERTGREGNGREEGKKEGKKGRK